MSDQPSMPLPPLSPEHALFAKDVGEWDAEVEIQMVPGAPPSRSTGRSVSRLLGGGRWLVTDFRNETGFEGHGIYTWDPVKQHYVGVWIDTMTQGVHERVGTWDGATRTMTMEYDAPLADGRVMRLRETTQQVDERTQVFRSALLLPGGVVQELMKVTYRKRDPS